VDLNELVAEAVNTLEPRPGIRVEADPGLPKITASPMALAQVVFQLLSNALRHHDKTSGLVRVSAQELEHAVEIRVQDDGPGIDPRHHERIFGICQTLKPKDGLEGCGVGLALVRKIVKKRGGTVALESQPGKGSTFSVTWLKGT